MYYESGIFLFLNFFFLHMKYLMELKKMKEFSNLLSNYCGAWRYLLEK